MIVSRVLWHDAGCPGVSKASAPSELPCYLCGGRDVPGVRLRDALGPNFTDHDKATCPASDHVCVACVWLLGGKPPDTFRLWSVVYREDREARPSNPKATYHHGPHTHCTSKSDISEILEVLLEPPDAPWICTVAESGQIHLLPFARVNYGREEWCVRYEREDVISTPEAFASVLHHVTSLLSAGYIRDDLVALDPHPSKLAKYGLETWRRHAEPLRKWRRSPLMALAVALTRKETYEHTRDRTAWASAYGRRAEPDCHPACLVDDGISDDRAHQPDGLVAKSEGRAEDRDSASPQLGRGGVHHGGQARNPDSAHGFIQGDLFAGHR